PARTLAEAGPGPVAAARELPPQRRAARARTPAPPGWPPLLRVPAPELVCQRGLRPASRARRRAGDRRRPAPAVPDPGADRRLHLPPLPPRWRRRQLRAPEARRVGPADRGVARVGGRLRVLQQRLGRVRGRERSLA